MTIKIGHVVKVLDLLFDTVSCEGKNPNTDKIFFSFCLFCVPRTWTGRIQMKSSMTFIRGDMCIEIKRKIILKMATKWNVYISAH